MPQNDYKDLDKYMTYTLIGTGIAFVLYLLFALLGIIWLKVVLSILIFLVCAGVLTVLYLSGEISKLRSRWMTLGAACTALCLFVSLITGYVSSRPHQSSCPDQRNMVSPPPLSPPSSPVHPFWDAFVPSRILIYSV